MNKWKFLVIIIFFSLSYTACTTSYNQLIKDSENTFYQGKYKEGAKRLLPLVNKKSREQLLYMMECGLMLHAAADYKNSNNVFLAAAKLADKITTSISKQAASLLLNETKTNYKGEDFERVLIHMYLGINFLMLNEADEARVEFKKVNELLRDINVTTGKRYKQNLMAKYLTAIAFEIIADKDNDENDREFAYIEYKQIYKLSPKFPLVHRDLLRLSKKLGDTEDYNQWKKKFRKGERIPKDAGELLVIYQAGRGAIKASRGKLLSDRSMKVSINNSLRSIPLKAGVTVAGVLVALKIAENPIPKFRKRSNRIKYLQISINGQDVDRTYILENIEKTAIHNMEDDYKRLYVKVAAGIAIKGAASVAAGLTAQRIAKQSKKAGGVAGLIGAAVGAGTGVALASQIKPDLRCWHTLPANLQIGRIFLPAGKYNINVKFLNQQGRIERTKQSKIEIKKGEKILLNYRTLF